MRYPKPTDRYSCEVLCENFMEVDVRLKELEENGGDGSALPPVTESDNGNILQVVNGAWMIVDGSGLGGSGVYVGSGDMPEGYNIQIDPSGEPTPIGGSSEWSDIKNKPFEVVGEDALTWDGNTDGKLVVEGLFVFVSDVTPSYADMVNGCEVCIDDGTDVATLPLLQEQFIDSEQTIMFNGEPFVVITKVDNVEWEGAVFPKKGVYFINVENLLIKSFKINGYSFATEKIKASALPSNLVTRADLDKALGTYITEVAELLGGEA